MEIGSNLLSRLGAPEHADALVIEWLLGLRAGLRNTRPTPDALIRQLQEIGMRIQREEPTSFVMMNIIQRAISMANDPGSLAGKRATRNLTTIITSLRSVAELPSAASLPSSEEIVDELLAIETDFEAAISLALRRVIPNDVLLIYVHSAPMRDFALKLLARNDVFLFVVRNTLVTNPLEWLPQNASNFLVIAETSSFAFMRYVNRVFMDAHAVLADGSLMHDAGVLAVCLAAQQHAIDVIVLTPLYRFTPLYSFGPDSINSYLNPAAIWPELRGPNNADALALRYDHVPAECITLLVCQAGEFPPQHAHRVIADYYSSLELGYSFK